MYNTNQTQTTQPVYMPQQYQVNRPIYPVTMQQSFMGLKGRPVASIEEARASIIDFDGSVFYFPDLANKRIYTKQINIDGTASLFVYELKEIPIEQEITSNQFVTREEFEAAIKSLRATALADAPTPNPVPTPAPAKVQLNF